MRHKLWKRVKSNAAALTFVVMAATAIATLLTGGALGTFAWLTYDLSHQARQPHVVATCDEVRDETNNLSYERITINNGGGPLVAQFAQVDRFMMIHVLKFEDEKPQEMTTYWVRLPGYFEKPQPTGNIQGWLFAPVKAKASVSWFESVKQDFSWAASNDGYAASISPRTYLKILYQKEDADNANPLEFKYYAINKNANSWPLKEKDYTDVANQAEKNTVTALTNGCALTIDDFDSLSLWNLCKNHILEGTTTIIEQQ
jgi:hypothetical protein